MNGVTKWLTLAFAVLVVVGGAIYAYGQLAGSVGDHERRIGRVERDQAEILETIHAIDKRTIRLEERQGEMMKAIEEKKGRGR